MSCRLDEDETNFGLVNYVSCTQLELYSHFAKNSKPTDKFTLYYPPYLRFWVYTNAYYEEYLPTFKGVFFFKKLFATNASIEAYIKEYL